MVRVTGRKNIVICIGGLMAIKKRHCTYAQTLRELRKKEAEINRNKSDGISSAGSNLRLDDVYNLWKKNKVGLKPVHLR